MKIFPCCKINLGLNIVSKRPDGYHNLETVFYPVPLCDVIDVLEISEKQFLHFQMESTGNQLDCRNEDNLIVKAYHLLATDHCLPAMRVALQKNIPSQAGLGGGSSDAAFMLQFLKERFQLPISHDALISYASKLGADCAFFIDCKPVFATGIGDVFHPLKGKTDFLQGVYVLIVKPDVSVSTANAFRHILPAAPMVSCKEAILQPIEMWKDLLANDFEDSVFLQYPELAELKAQLYAAGAVYAQMSGSGSSVFGLFKENPEKLREAFRDHFVFISQL